MPTKLAKHKNSTRSKSPVRESKGKSEEIITFPKAEPPVAIGRHLGIRDDKTNFIGVPEVAANIGCKVFQIFTGSPRCINGNNKLEIEFQKFGMKLEEFKRIMVIHSNYMINLCHPVGSRRYSESVDALIKDLKASEHIGSRCLGVVVHMGKNILSNNLTDNDAMDNYIEGIEECLRRTKNGILIMETGASQGSEIASNTEGMSEIYWRVPEEQRDRIKFCIDTCHIWASGYDISTKAGVKQYFSEFDDQISISQIACIHFNDSKNKCGSHVDRHADLGYGMIPVEGLRAVARFAAKHQIPLIMETHLAAINPKTKRKVSYRDELNTVLKWISD